MCHFQSYVKLPEGKLVQKTLVNYSGYPHLDHHFLFRDASHGEHGQKPRLGRTQKKWSDSQMVKVGEVGKKVVNITFFRNIQKI